MLVWDIWQNTDFDIKNVHFCIYIIKQKHKTQVNWGLGVRSLTRFVSKQKHRHSFSLKTNSSLPYFSIWFSTSNQSAFPRVIILNFSFKHNWMQSTFDSLSHWKDIYMYKLIERKLN